MAAAAEHGRADFGVAWRRGLSYASAASLPAVVLLAAFAAPTADVLAIGNLRHDFLIEQLAACLAVIAAAQMIGGLHDLGRQALFARLDDRGPRTAAGLATGVSLAVAIATLLLPADGHRLVGLVGALLAGEVVATLVVFRRVVALIRPDSAVNRHELALALRAASAMLPVVVAGAILLAVAEPTRPGVLACLVGSGTLALGVYVLVLRRTGLMGERK
jgi:hypothetical protein